MDSMIREINENLKTIIDNLKETRDNSEALLENIQFEMDKKVEEAKKYKIQVDSSKEKIKLLEDENRSLELSLDELNDKYGKMNLVSIVEAGNKEIKSKINSNLKDINVEKEHIADLTNKARVIKDLLIDLKKDKTAKEQKLENMNVIYEYYNRSINNVIDYALNHSENLEEVNYNPVNINYNESSDEPVIDNVELENTMVFDEIANIDENKTFKDEFTFINNQIEEKMLEDNNLSDVNLDEESVDEEFDFINKEVDENSVEETNYIEEEKQDEVQEEDDVYEVQEELEKTLKFDNTTNDVFDFSLNSDDINEDDDDENGGTLEQNPFEEKFEEEMEEGPFDDNIFIDANLTPQNNLEQENNDEISSVVEEKEDITSLDEENEKRLSQINDLFANFNEDTIVSKPIVNDVENKIDEAYLDIFGKSIDENDLNKKQPTLTDIFGNPISKDELSEEVIISKKIEDLFVDNGIDFNKFREDEKNYLKQIYDEEKFNSILDVLKKNKINLDNIYNAFNIFGEINYLELDTLINKFLNIGQSIEAIGLVLEKLPKVKKYNLDEAIISYGDYIKDVDITELIMKAKELYKDGGNL